jgi:hypothetical protein
VTAAPHGPYRESAAPAAAAGAASRWPRRIVVGLAALVVAGTAGAVVWASVPWTRHVELWTTREALPPHGRVAAVYWSDEGWALAVGAKGQVFLREGDAPPDVARERWRALPTTTDADLTRVARASRGEAPWVDDHAIVVGVGAILECTRARCVVLERGGTHRALASGGGETLVVGDGGSVFRVVPYFTDLPIPLPHEEESPLRADAVGVGATSDFRAVELECQDDEDASCTAVLHAEGGVVVRGTRKGRCDTGTRYSGSQNAWCRWTWTRDPSPAPLAPARELQAWAPVDVVDTKLGRTRSVHTRAVVTFGASPHAHVDGSPIALRTGVQFVAAATYLGIGEETLLVDDAGDVYLAR